MDGYKPFTLKMEDALHWNTASHLPGYTDSNPDTHSHQSLKSHSHLTILYVQAWKINFILRIWRLTHAYPDVSLVWSTMGYLFHILSQITYPEPQQLCFRLKIIILKQFLSSLLLSTTISCYTIHYFIFTTHSPKTSSIFSIYFLSINICYKKQTFILYK